MLSCLAPRNPCSSLCGSRCRELGVGLAGKCRRAGRPEGAVAGPGTQAVKPVEVPGDRIAASAGD